MCLYFLGMLSSQLHVRSMIVKTVIFLNKSNTIVEILPLTDIFSSKLVIKAQKPVTMFS